MSDDLGQDRILFSREFLSSFYFLVVNLLLRGMLVKESLLVLGFTHEITTLAEKLV